MRIYAAIALINFLVVSTLAILVLTSNIRSKLNHTYALANLSVAFWSFFYIFWQLSSNYDEAYFYLKMLMIGAAFMPVFVFHFILTYTKNEKAKKMILPFIYLTGLSFVYLIVIGKLFDYLTQKMGFPFWPNAGIALTPFITFFFLVIVYSMYLLYRYYLNVKGFEKERTRYLFFGLIIAIIAGSPNYALWYDIQLPPVLNPLFSVYVAIIAYAITRYRLMDIEFIIRKGLLYSALTAVISAVYFSLIYVTDFFFKTLTGYNFLWVTIPSLFVLAIFFQPLKNYLQQRIDKTFFKTKYEADKIRVKFSDGINKLMKIDDLAKYINRTAYKVFKLSGSAAYIFDEEQRKYICRDARGTMASQKGSGIGESDPLIIEIKKSQKVILRDEQKAMMQQGGRTASGSLYAELKNMNARICVPSLSGKKDYRLIAFLIADEKKSQDQFTSEDVMLLETIANQAVLNIENAVLYQAMIEARKRKLQVERLSELGNAASSVAKEARAALAPIIEFSHQFKHRWDDPLFLGNAQEYLPFEVERLRLILIGILEFSRESKYASDRINLKKIVNSMMDLIKYEARNKKIQLDDHVEESIEISADKDRIRHVLLNLLINAMDAMPYGGKIWVSGGIEEGKAVIKVSDTGIGITSDVMQKMFDPFFTTKRNAIGLGLAIVKKVIEGHGGSVEVYSEVGKGTTFVLKLPQVSP